MDAQTIRIAGCRPVDWSVMPTVPGLGPTPIYPGSIIQACQWCAKDIYVGPKVQELDGTTIRLCLLCAVAAAQGRKMTLTDLGNTFVPRK
jgi:hypothetical protein